VGIEDCSSTFLKAPRIARNHKEISKPAPGRSTRPLKVAFDGYRDVQAEEVFAVNPTQSGIDIDRIARPAKTIVATSD
jgi:hypothetical protein